MAMSIELEDEDDKVLTTEQTLEFELMESTTSTAVVTTLKKQWPNGLQKHQYSLKKSRLFIIWWSSVVQSVFGLLRERHPIAVQPNNPTDTQSQGQNSLLLPPSAQDEDLIVHHIVNGPDMGSPISDNNAPNFELPPSE